MGRRLGGYRAPECWGVSLKLLVVVSLMVLAAFSSVAAAAFEKHLLPLPSPLVKEMERKNMSASSPILVRIFKEESELEIWKQENDEKFVLLKTYPICRWAGELGPKVREGDRQAPEGFYTVTPGQMNPRSQLYLSFNLGYPNTFDRAYGRTGSALMVHGDCLSAGCYAMTDEQMAEIYALAREAFAGGQPAFQVQAFPFRMNALNMARHRNNPNMPFWKNLKQGYDHFQLTRQQVRVDVCERRYVFNANPPKSARKLEFNGEEACPAYEVPDFIATAIKGKTQKDEIATLDLVRRGTEEAPVHTGADGGMHPVFIAALKPPPFNSDGKFQFPWNKSPPGTVPAHVVPPKNASEIFAATMAAHARQASTDGARTRVPIPRAAPRKDHGATAEIASFDERFGPFITASRTAMPMSALVRLRPASGLSREASAASRQIMSEVAGRHVSAELTSSISPAQSFNSRWWAAR